MNNRAIEITKRFMESWEETERIFDLFLGNGGFERLKPVKKFITELKLLGANQNFRIGTSMYSLIISRSVEHGLRENQKYIKIDTIELNDYDVVFRDGLKKYSEFRMSDLNDVRLEKLLKMLKETIAD